MYAGAGRGRGAALLVKPAVPPSPMFDANINRLTFHLVCLKFPPSYADGRDYNDQGGLENALALHVPRAPTKGHPSMNAFAPHRLASASLLVSLLAISSTGCTVLSRGNLNSKPLDADQAAALTQDPADNTNTTVQPTVTVSIKPEFGRCKTVTLPLDYGMTLQNALLETKVTRRFRDMDINVMRVTPQSRGQRVPLQADYDTVKNRVGILHDMTLHPGDHIMIVETSTSPIDDAISRFTGKRR